jgi:hypothetical protein
VDFLAGFFTAAFTAVFGVFRAALFLAALARPAAFFELFLARRAAFFGAFFAAVFALLRALPRVAFFAGFFFFFATPDSSSCRACRRPDHTIASVSNRDEGRVRIFASPGGLRIEILPLARTRAGRARLAAVSGVVLAATLYGAAHLGEAWEAGLRRGEFTDLPLGILVALTVAIAVSTPLAFIGLSALAFSEEIIAVGPETVTIETAAFEKTRVRSIRLRELESWRETYLPLPPWWTWAVKRLAARVGGSFEPLAGAAGPKDKRLIAIALARATGKPLMDDWGHRISI